MIIAAIVLSLLAIAVNVWIVRVTYLTAELRRATAARDWASCDAIRATMAKWRS